MAEDVSTYVYTEDVSESANPSTPVTKGTLQMSNMSTPVMRKRSLSFIVISQKVN